MTPADTPETEGLPFSKVYLKRERQLDDSKAARKRLLAWAEDCLKDKLTELGKTLKYQLGNDDYIDDFYGNLKIDDFFNQAPISDVLSSITYIYKILASDPNLSRRSYHTHWIDWVRRVFDEETLAYRIDDKGGTHPRRDFAFDFSVDACIDALSKKRYRSVLDDFKKAIEFLNDKKSTYKHAIIAAFHALEGLTCIVSGKNSIALGPEHVDKYLLPCVLAQAKDEHERSSLSQYMTGLRNIINAGQVYRHSKADEDTYSPSPEYALNYVNSLAPYIRIVAVAYSANNPERD